MSRRPATFTEADLNRQQDSRMKYARNGRSVFGTLTDEQIGMMLRVADKHGMELSFAPGGVVTMHKAAPSSVAKEDKPRREWVYFVRAKLSGYIKIGFTRVPNKRIGTIMTDCPEPVELIGKIAGSLADERALHARFADHRLNGEWFRPAPELIEYVEALFR